MTKTIKEVQKETLKETLQALNRYHKVAVIRPTGFGKTWMLTKLISKTEYKKVLYVYPALIIGQVVMDRYNDIIEQNEDGYNIDEETLNTEKAVKKIDKCTMMTYQKLALMTEDELNDEFNDYDLILFDECHRMGASKAKQNLMYLFNVLAKNKDDYDHIVDIVGATATPLRTDTFDVVSAFFSNHTISVYNLHNAIEDGFIQKPIYCFTTYNLEKDIKNRFEEKKMNVNIKGLANIIDYSKVQIENIINSVCTAYIDSNDRKCMRFIVFFSNIKKMEDEISKVEGWFKSAFNTHTVKTIKVSSANAEQIHNQYKVSKLKNENNTIYLIGCIDMLNQGIHIDDLTGVVFCRGTESSIIYSQQFGRALSVGAKKPAIVFDIADNLHNEMIYKITGSYNANISNHSEEFKDKKLYEIDQYKLITEKKLLIDEETGEVTEEIINKIYYFNTETNKMIETPYKLAENKNGNGSIDILDEYGNKTTLVYLTRLKKVMSTVDPYRFKNINKIEDDDVDLVTTTEIAEYEDYINKIVMQPIVDIYKTIIKTLIIYDIKLVRIFNMNEFPTLDITEINTIIKENTESKNTSEYINKSLKNDRNKRIVCNYLKKQGYNIDDIFALIS